MLRDVLSRNGMGEPEGRGREHGGEQGGSVGQSSEAGGSAALLRLQGQ